MSLGHQIRGRNIRSNMLFCGIFLVVFLFSISNLVFSNYSVDGFTVEVTGKVLIKPPNCPPGEVYDRASDTCTPKPSSNNTGNPDNPLNPTVPPEPAVPRPIILIPNASDVETKEGGQLIPFQQIVIVNSTSKDIQSLNSTIQALTDIVENLGAEVIYSYNSAIAGFAFKAPNQQVTDNVSKTLSSDPRVSYVEQDKTVVPFSEEIPTGIKRIDGTELYSIPKTGSFTADVDIAIIDSGVDLDNPELNLKSSFSTIVPQIQNARESDVNSIVNNNVNLDKLGLNIFTAGGNTSSFYPPFTTSRSASPDDTCGHGTHVAGVAAAKADARGVVGVAPNARLWAVKVLDYNKLTRTCEGSISSVIAAIEYVTRLKDQIDVVNLSLGCKCNSSALDDAISRSVKANITYVIAAGNKNDNASSWSPASHKDANHQKDVITVSAMTDLDGICGGKSHAQFVRAGEFQSFYNDDAFAKFSNYGSVIDIAAPGVLINSTGVNGTYSLDSGTSVAAPHVAGAAALYKILNPTFTPYDIRRALINDGIQSTTVCDGLSHGYFEKDSHSAGEPLLYVDELIKKLKQGSDDIPLQIKQLAKPPLIRNVISEDLCSSVTRPPVDVVFSIDSSPSMRDNDATNLRLNSSKSFVEKLNSTSDRAAIVSWGGKLGFKSDLISNFDVVKYNLDTNISIDAASYPSSISQANTDYNIGINEAIKSLDSSPRNSSKIIIFLSDGQHNAINPAPLSNGDDSPLEYAKSKGYKLFAIGLNISPGSDGEKLLRTMAESTGGQYFSSPSAQNLEVIFNSIFVQEVQHFQFENSSLFVTIKGTGGTSERSSPKDESTSPEGATLIETFPDYVLLNEKSFSTSPASISKNDAGETVVEWKNILKGAGNNDNKFSPGEELTISFPIGFNDKVVSQITTQNKTGSNLFENISKTALKLKVPIIDEQKSFLRYQSPDGRTLEQPIPQVYIELNLKTCKNQQISKVA